MSQEFVLYFFPIFLNFVLTSRDAWNIIYQYVYVRTSVSVVTKHITKIKVDNNLEVYKLANIKSAKKRIEVAAIRTAKNKSIRSEVKTATMKVEAAVVANDKAVAVEALKSATSVIESAASKGVYHKNNAARKVSRLAKLVNGIA